MTTETVWMTPATRQLLEQELAVLERNESADPARARELRVLLRNAEVATKPDDGLVEAGMRVTVRFERDGSESTFLLGSRELCGLDPDIDTEVYSLTSPLGLAITGHYVSDEVTFLAPSGEQKIAIVAATPFR